MSQTQIENEQTDASEIHRIISAFIEQELIGGASDSSLRIDDDLLTSGIVDSLGVMRLVGFVEEEFGVATPPEDVTIEHFVSVLAIAGYILKRRNSR